MKLIAPYGYGEIVPLRRQDRVLLPHGLTPHFCRGLNALAVSASEFVAAARDYPLVFATQDGGQTFAPVAVLGLRLGENLFVDRGGNWERGAYMPAFARRYPFCLSKIYVDGEPRTERMVCVASDYVDPAGRPLYDEADQPTAEWREIEQLLTAFEADLDATAAMCADLARRGLLSPFSMRAGAAGEGAFQVQGMYRVEEERLRALPARDLKTLVSSGTLSAVFAHIHSLANFSRLYQRATAVAEDPPAEDADEADAEPVAGA